ncbi:MAG: DinB family protein [Gilvibacter sp.]
MLQTLNNLFTRDLDRLSQEISAYNSEADLWLTPEGISNSAGTLSLHLIGNLNHFIGACLGDTGYVRQRDKEFTDRGVAVSKMVEDIEEVKAVISQTLSKLNDAQLTADFPINVFSDQQKVTIGFMLTHLAGHLNYHLGQINYHRRLLA